ncbi:MAG TPA: SRPBCC family protein [Acidimicrobiales bacterium]|nr:SRPBCC family protein [Acidimicrobiales bacterium]
MTTTTGTKTTQMYRVFIKATPEAIWDAITRPEWTRRYGYHSVADYDLRPGGHYFGHATEEMQSFGMPATVVDGEVIEVDPPRRLVHTWRFLWSDEIKAEGPTRVTFEIAPGDGGVSSLTVTHEIENAPETAAMLAGEVENAGGGWAYVLSDLKSLLETGKALEEG